MLGKSVASADKSLLNKSTTTTGETTFTLKSDALSA